LRYTGYLDPVARLEVLRADPERLVLDEFRHVELDITLLGQDIVY
jgi:hypothetical protein